MGLIVFLILYHSDMRSWGEPVISPNSTMALIECANVSEHDSHVAYGNHLYLTKTSQIDEPDDGYLIYAGYCKGIRYKWISANKIELDLNGCKTEHIKTLSKKAIGIDVDVIE